MAGESARAKAAQLRRSAERWEQGAEGEEATADALGALPPPWTVLHDLAWPGRQFANIDHVAVGPQGVFVIDTKNWSGHVTVNRTGLHQDGRDRTTAVWGASAAAASVASLVTSLRREHVHPVVCLAGGDIRTSRVEGVLVCSSDRLIEAMTSYREVLPGGVTKAVAADVGRRLQPSGEPRQTWAMPTADQRRRRRPWRGLATVVIGFLVAAALLTYPQAVTSAVDRVADVFVEQEDSGGAPEDRSEPTRQGERERKRRRPTDRPG